MDKEISKLINKELARQNGTINLIASENYPSKEVLEALGSVFTSKYAEGYPGRRYYAGNSISDEIEELAKKRALKLYNLQPANWSVNVQPYSGSPANLAVYFALVPPGGKIMGLRLDMGGHLTHGHRVSATGKLWTQVPYGVDSKTEKIDYEALLKMAKRERPNIIVAGFTAYPRKINFQKFGEIASSAGALLMADVAHIAGLIAAGVHPSPFPYADVVTTTTHKTLRGPRAALIFSKKKWSEAIDKAVFPGLQGGPHLNQIAATAVALKEAKSADFKKYARQILRNAKALAAELKRLGWRIVSGGTENHLILVDVARRGLSGKSASDLLEGAGIIVNKNTIPYDKRLPTDPSGLRIGTPAMTTRGMKEREMIKIAELIDAVLLNKKPFAEIRKEVLELSKKFPLPY
ncbi:MAG: Serine hydroxymethyltransferase [Candidatus Jorgensenbacteria bacterium GW2011_GWA1_48_13]|uniref:Serine hydroxymethyltransferase n=2 Tax=Candidatus Joergenseniibacteriota TaxID=1752739 RepID=A0A0G1YJU0_9BACT|nr:MAG: Serine hydroxymethyltransferase [Candidatus Jorgensenbacteria bacterium GW2011_GWA1_48_13]KKU99382.1 MAG: Serine hydroxymethyltransferase [Candidatus Jorgensenbacteria bacterium GW2011_GWC1_48_8]KKW15267.1 MAG: Serine hydroxymethyltransferase [Candidatus Jorgensenbacteria bacterium GW2011_GWB1_50_10]